jgi:hypothetical protein
LVDEILSPANIFAGYINVGIKYGEIEFGFKHRKKIKFLINKNNGAICCSVITNLN